MLPSPDIIRADILTSEDLLVALDTKRIVEHLFEVEYGEPTRRLHPDTKGINVYGKDDAILLDEPQLVRIEKYRYYKIGSLSRGQNLNAFEEIVDKLCHSVPADHVTISFYKQ